MRISVPLLALSPAISVVRGAKVLYQQKFDERFTIYDGACSSSLFCTEDLTHPVNGLSWTNVHSAARYTPFDLLFLHPGGQIPPFAAPRDPNPYLFGLYTGEAINVTKPTVATSHYNGSCVKYWELNTIVLGCSVLTFNESDFTQNELNPANCTIKVEGFDHKGRCVGHEIFSYRNVTAIEWFPRFWYESTYNTTKRGLKGKKLRTLKIKADVEYNPKNQRDPELGIGQMLYTVYNNTKCS